jgi:hypothetical protein
MRPQFSVAPESFAHLSFNFIVPKCRHLVSRWRYAADPFQYMPTPSWQLLTPGIISCRRAKKSALRRWRARIVASSKGREAHFLSEDLTFNGGNTDTRCPHSRLPREDGGWEGLDLKSWTSRSQPSKNSLGSMTTSTMLAVIIPTQNSTHKAERSTELLFRVI